MLLAALGTGKAKTPAADLPMYKIEQTSVFLLGTI